MNKKLRIIIAVIVIIIIGVAGFFIAKKIEQENRKYDIENISEYNYFVIKEDNKYGIMDKEGKTIIEPNYDNIKIPNPTKAVFFCYQDDEIIAINDKNEKIFIEYENVTPLRLKNISSDLMYEKSVLKYKENGKYGLIDFNGKKITKAIYDEIDTLQFKEGELLAKSKEKYGVINIKGHILVKIKYDKVEVDKYYSSDGNYKKAGYIVCNTTNEGYRYGYVNTNGKEIIETKYNDLYRVTDIQSEDIYIIAADNGKYGMFKNNKQIIKNDYQSLVYNSENNLVTALKGKKYGVITLEEKVIVPFQYNQIDATGKYIYATESNEKVVVFDDQGKESDIGENTAIINVQDTNYEIYIKSTNDSTIYSIYEDLKKKTNKSYTYIEYLYNDYFIACNSNNKIGIIDSDENIKVDFKYDSMRKIENTTIVEFIDDSTKNSYFYSKDTKQVAQMKNAVVENENNYIKIYNNQDRIYLSTDGQVLEYTDIKPNNELYAKKQNGKWGFVDSKGNKIINYEYDFVTELNQYGFAGIQKDGKWGIINKEGKIIVNPIYELTKEKEPNFIGKYYEATYGNGEIYYSDMK